MQFLKSCILKRDAVESVIEESYHEIIFEIYKIAPQSLLSVIPELVHELTTEQVDVRIKALNLFRELLALHGQQVARDYPHVFNELLNRLSDKSAEVRLTALSCAKALYIANQPGREVHEILSAIQGRLLDHDDKVRVEAVNLVCDLAKNNLKLSPDLIAKAAERLRDKKAFVRSKALKKFIELYQEYCMKYPTGISLLNVHIEKIPCKILMLCYEKDCLEFRPQSMELVLADLFPASLSIEERTQHWIFMFSLFNSLHLKSLKTILSQKQRLRVWLQDYLDIRNRVEDNVSVEAEKKVEALVAKMSLCFPDSAKAKDCFQKLKEVKDNEIFILLQQFLRNQTTLNTETMKDVSLRTVGDQKVLSEFIQLLSKKCSFNIFSFEHVHVILNSLSSGDDEMKHLKIYQVQLLLTIISVFPSLLKGSEKQFKVLLHEGEIPFNEQLIEMLAREGSHMSIELSDVYSSLEKVCLEGTRAQSKLAVSAFAALAGTSRQPFFSKLCKMLVDSLCNGQNAPTVLQSLGCLAQYSVSSFEDQEKVITHYIIEEIFQPNNALTSKDLDIDESSTCCSSCKLKIFGLKALVRSFLPHKHARLIRPISFLLDVIQQMLQKCGFPAGSTPCEHDGAFISLAAAKSVLRLSRKWDLHISPQLFRLTILIAKDHSSAVRRSFASKIHKLLNSHSVPSRYACAFSFVALDSLEDLRKDGLKYLEEFIREYGKRSQLHETTTMQESANHPAYLVVFLIHVLAHDPNIPSPDCRDENIYAEFLSPLFVTVQALVNEMLIDGNLRHKYNASLFLRSIFMAIKRADDAVDPQMTPKLHLLAAVGISILDSLNINITPIQHAPGIVLLPSSLYKCRSSEMREAAAYPLIGCKTDASFTKKLVSRLKFEVSGIVQTDNKHSQQYLLPSSGRPKMSNLKSADKDNLLIARTEEQIVEQNTGQKKQFNNGGQEKPAISSHTRPVVLNNKSFGVENKHERDAHDKPTLSQNEVIESCSMEENTVSKCDIGCVGPSKLSRDGEKSKQVTKSNGETLVGKRIKLWSAIEKCYYSGLVDGFDSSQSTHKVTYKTGDVDILSLDSETWEIEMYDLQAQHGGNTSANTQAELLDFKQVENMPKKRDTCTQKTHQPVRRSKRNKDAFVSSNVNDEMDDLQAQCGGSTSANAQAEILDSTKQVENMPKPKKRDNCTQKTSQPVRRSKRNKEAIASSNVNDNTRKTRSRKV